MTADTNDAAALRDFEAFLDVHGANRSRWPAQKRLQFASLLASSAAARRMLAEAEALDRLLDTIEETPAETAETSRIDQARVDRIMSAALAKSSAPQVPAPQASANAGDTPVSNVVPLRPAPRKAKSLWPVAAMMAASLLLGVTTGATTMSKLNAGADVASTDAANEAALDPAYIALDNDSYGPLGGDVL